MNTHQFTPTALSLMNQINEAKDVLTADDLSALMLSLVTSPNYRPIAGSCIGIPDENCVYFSNCNKVCNKCGKIHSGKSFKPELKTEINILYAEKIDDTKKVVDIDFKDCAAGFIAAAATQVAFDYRPYEAVCRDVEKLLKESGADSHDASKPYLDQSVMILDSLDYVEVILELEDMYGIDITDEYVGDTGADITREESTTLHKFVEVVCKKKGISMPSQ